MGGGYVRLSQTRGGCDRGAALGVLLSPRGYLRSLKFDKSTNHISFPTRSHITGSDITIVIKHNSVYHTVPEKRAQVSESNENH
jgi:hypothetical protein